MRPAVLALLVLAGPALAQPDLWRSDFRVPGAEGGRVLAVASDTAGVLAGGTFETVDGVPARGVASWDGAAWKALGGGVVGEVLAVARDTAGAVWVAGRVTEAVQPDGGRLAVRGVARWRGGRWEAVGGPEQGEVRVLHVHDGAVVAGGPFGGFRQPDGAGLAAVGAVRWTGEAWERLGVARAVFGLARGPDGALLAGGDGLRAHPDSAAFRAGRWSEAEGAWRPLGYGLAGPRRGGVSALATSGGAVFAGGTFGASGSDALARWDGAAWEHLDGPPEAVVALASDGAGGAVAGYGRRPGLSRWTPDGGWTHARTLVTHVHALAAGGGRTVAGGDFLATAGADDGTTRVRNLARLGEGAAFDVLRPVSALTGRDGVSGRVVDLDAACGRLLAASVAGIGPEQTRVAWWDGAAWNGLALPAEPRGQGVWAASARPGRCNEVAVGGWWDGPPFPSANVMRRDGAAWAHVGRGTDDVVYTVAYGPDGALYVGGAFETVYQADGTALAASGVARWTEAEGWSPLGGGLRYDGPAGYPLEVFDVLPRSDGSIVVAGRFDRVVDADGTARPSSRVARWTGAGWEPVGGVLDAGGDGAAVVTAVAEWRGALVVAGLFWAVEGADGAENAAGVAVREGGAWAPLPDGPRGTYNSDLAVALGRLVVSGTGVALWDGAAWTPVAGGSDGPVVVADGVLYAAGAEAEDVALPPHLAAYDLARALPSGPPPAGTAPALRVAPNPVRGSATLSFRVAEPGPVRLELYDALGRRLAVLVDRPVAAGPHRVRLDAGTLPAGVYVARLEAGARAAARALTVVR